MDNEQNTTDIIPFRAANSRLYRIICTDSLSVSLLDTDQRSRQLLTSVVHYFESNRFFDTSSGKKTLYSIIDNNKFHLLKQLLTFGDFQEGLIRNPSVCYTLFLKAVSKNRDNCLEVFLNDEVMFSFFLNYLDAQPPQKKINVFKSLWGSCQKNKCFDLLVSKQSFVELYPLDFLINLSAFLIRGANKELSLSVVHRFITSPKLNRQFASLPLFDIPRDLTYRAEQKAKKLQINFKRLLSVLFVYYPKSFQFIKNKLDQLCPDKVDQAFLELFRDFEPLSETIFIVESVPIYSPSFYRIFKNTFSKDAQEYINFSTLFFARLTSKYGESVDMRQSLQKISSILKSLSKDQFYQLNTFLFSHRKHLNIVSNALDFDKIFDNYITKIEYAKVLLEQSLPLSFFDKLEPRAKHFIFSILKDEDLTPILKKTKLKGMNGV